VNAAATKTGDVDLPNTVPALPGEQNVPFDEDQRILHRSLMRLLDPVPQRAGRRPPTMSTPT
jgi:hypothetical protein